MKAPIENPKDVIGSKKLSFAVLPFRVLAGVALAMLEGALKYGRQNYRAAGVRGSVYFDATLRHIMDWWEGTDIDPDSDLHHLDKAIAALMVLRDSMIEGNYIDDRPPRGNVDMVEFNKKAAALIERYGHVKPRHYTIMDSPPEQVFEVTGTLGDLPTITQVHHTYTDAANLERRVVNWEDIELARIVPSLLAESDTSTGFVPPVANRPADLFYPNRPDLH